MTMRARKFERWRMVGNCRSVAGKTRLFYWVAKGPQSRYLHLEGSYVISAALTDCDVLEIDDMDEALENVRVTESGMRYRSRQPPSAMMNATKNDHRGQIMQQEGIKEASSHVSIGWWREWKLFWRSSDHVRVSFSVCAQEYVYRPCWEDEHVFRSSTGQICWGKWRNQETNFTASGDGALCYRRLQLHSKQSLKTELFSTASMSCNWFGKFRNWLHIVDVNGDHNSNGRLWKVRPRLEKFRQKCLNISLGEHLCFDAQTIVLKENLDI